MAKVYPQAYWVDGQVVTPDEVNAELANIFGEYNGRLDRENITDLTDAAFALDSFNAIATQELSVPVTASHDQTGSNDGWQGVPDGVSGDMGVDVVCLDGALEIDVGMSWMLTTPRPAVSSATMALGIFIDGALVATSGKDRVGQLTAATKDAYDSRAVMWAGPIAAGLHRVEMRYIIGILALGGAYTFEFQGRGIWARNLRR